MDMHADYHLFCSVLFNDAINDATCVRCCRCPFCLSSESAPVSRFLSLSSVFGFFYPLLHKVIEGWLLLSAYKMTLRALFSPAQCVRKGAKRIFGCFVIRLPWRTYGTFWHGVRSERIHYHTLKGETLEAVTNCHSEREGERERERAPFVQSERDRWKQKWLSVTIIHF